jgi:N-acetylneuraminic acid mutarotase
MDKRQEQQHKYGGQVGEIEHPAVRLPWFSRLRFSAIIHPLKFHTITLRFYRWSIRLWLPRSPIPRAIRKWLAIPRNRIFVGGSLIVVLGLIGYVIVSNQLMARRYQLLPSITNAVGPADTALLSLVHYDPKQAMFVLSALKPSANSGNSISVGSSLTNPGYSFQLPTKLSKGILVTDPVSKLTMQLIPTTDALIGHQVDNHFVYPLSKAGAQDIFTVKANGLQEDIALPNGLTHSLSFSYTLKLPSDLQARQNGDGTIGIYSAASALFGNISYGTSADQVLVDTARQNGPKSTLVFALPAPVIEEANKPGFPSPPTRVVQVSYQLKGNQLTLVVHVSHAVAGPIVIDPSIVVAGASGFNTGNNEGDIAINSTNNTMSQAGLTGGSISAGWTATTSLPTATYNATSVAYNGYLYEIGGYTTAATAVVDYASINSNGTLGSWTATTSLPTATYNATSVAYNGYLYEIGGYTTAATAVVDYASINSNGTLGSWTATTSLPTATDYATSVAYNGYLYEIGGYNGAYIATVDYASINSNGTLGSWTATTSLPVVNGDATSVAYNGYLYEIGGNNGAYTATVDYAPINANGTIGSWTATTSLPAATAYATSVAYNGYLYEIGGSISGGITATVDYDSINSNGTLGATWTVTNSLPTASGEATSVAYNGYLYEIGGWTNSGATAIVDYAPIDPAGVVSGWTATTSLLNPTEYATSVAYNGYLYEIGGYNVAYVADVDRARINADGTLGSWTVTTSLPTATDYATSVAYNGYLYEIGGSTSGGITATVEYDSINSNGTLGATWTATTSLPVSTDIATSVAYNGYLYEIGGSTSGGITATVDYDSINSNGTLGATWTATTSLPVSTDIATSVAYNGYLYEIGGYTTTNIVTVDYAPINANGTIGAWTATTSLPTGTGGATSVVYNGYLYEIGGSTSSGTTATVDYAPINANGTIGAWTATTSLPAANSRATSVIYNGYLYEMGGYTTTYAATVDVAQINNGGPGTTSAWTATTSLPAATYWATSVVYNSYLYEIGGYNGTAALTTVDYAPINSNGTIGGWAATTSLPTATNSATSAVYNGYVYEIGGSTVNGTAGVIATVEYASINANGTLGSWTSTTSLPVATLAAASVIYNGYVYEIGGNTSSGDTTSVDYASINGNGTLGSWTTTTSLPVAIEYATSVIYNGYVYEIGGFPNGITAVVDYAPINSNGTLGAWTSTTSLPTAAYGATSVAYNGYIYEIGYPATVEYAPINANGTLGAWTWTANLPTGLDYATSVVYNGYVYEIGGYGPTATVDVAGLQSIPRIGGYSRLVDLTGSSTNDPTPIELLTNGTNVGNPGIGGVSGIGTGGVTVNYSFASNACATLSTPKTISTGIGNQLGMPFKLNFTTNGCGTATNIGRYVWVHYTLDDSQTASFPDINGNHTTINNFTVFYAPASAYKLRGGVTFSNGSSQALYAPP